MRLHLLLSVDVVTKPKKEATFRFRLTPEQRALLQAAADAAFMDLSTWVRATLLRAATEVKP
jgi:uncharacterized protein (DUF1778 family)